MLHFCYERNTIYMSSECIDRNKLSAKIIQIHITYIHTYILCTYSVYTYVYYSPYRTLTGLSFFRAVGVCCCVGFPLRPLSAFLIPLCNSYTNSIFVFFSALNGAPLLSSEKQPLSSHCETTNSGFSPSEYPSYLIFPDIDIC